jgi:hypothetical protein
MMTSQVSFKSFGLAVGAALLTLRRRPCWRRPPVVRPAASSRATCRSSTYGSGTTDGSSLGVSGGGEARLPQWRDGEHQLDAKLNQRRAMQRSSAVARDDDERARSRTRTTVRNGGDVRSRTMSIYKADGESRSSRETRR